MKRKEEIREAVEVGKNEMEKMEYYLGDTEMELTHRDRMHKMVKALQTLIDLAKDYLAIPDDKLLPKEKEIELDKEKIKGIFTHYFETELDNGERKISTDKYDMEYLSKEIAKADIIKVKETNDET